MFLRCALAIGVVSQVLLAEDFSPTLLTNQNTGTLRDLNRQALDRQIRSSLRGKQPAAKNPECSIPLAQVKIDNTKQFAMKSLKMPKLNFDSIAKAPPVPACER